MKIRPPRVKLAGASDPLETIDLPMLTGVRVLIVDDERDGRMLIARILEERGAQPTCASNVMEALEFLSRQTFDILLSDIGMPEMDGYELMRRVRALKDQMIPAIAVTAYARPEDRQRALLAGYHMHLSKPIEARELDRRSGEPATPDEVAHPCCELLVSSASC